MASLSFGRTKRRLLSTFILALGLVVQPFSMVMANTAYAASTATVCAATCDYTTLQDAVNGVDAGGVITLMEDVTLNSQVTITKPLTIDGANSYGIDAAFAKTDNSNNSAISIIGTSNVTIQDLWIDGSDPLETQLHGVNVYESSDVSLNGLSISNMSNYGVVVNSSSVAINSIYTEDNGWGGVNVDQVTQPADVTMTGNNYHGEFVGLYTEGPGATMTDNTLSHQYSLDSLFPGIYHSTGTNTQGPVMNWESGESFDTIQAAIDDGNTLPGHDIEVSAGTYNENVVLTKAVNLFGEGADTTKIVATNANASPLTFATNNATVFGFTLTHEYTAGELAAWNFNNNGVTFNQFTSGNTLEHSTVTLSRNGVYMNNASATLSNNTITNNRTGINSTNTINGSTFVGNDITDNWTVGWVYYQANSAMTTDFSTLTITGNNFSGNWYSEIVIKDAPTSTGMVNVSYNTFGDSPVTRSTALANSTNPSIDEPGFAVQKPGALGGSATAPSHSIPTLRIYNSNGVTLAYTPASVAPGETLDLDVDSGSATTYNTVTLSSGGASPVIAVIPSGTVVTADPAWDGTVNTPTVTSFTTPGAFTTGLAIMVGSNNYNLTFDKPVKLVLPGQAGKRVGFTPVGSSTFTEITTVCSTNDALGIGSANECKINVGGDLVVWTKHFTIFATFTPQTVSQGGNTSGTSTTRSGNVFSPTVYDDTWMEGANTKEGETFGEVKSNNVGVSGTATVSDDLQELPTNGISWYWWLLGGVLAAGAWSLVSLIRSGRFNR